MTFAAAMDPRARQRMPIAIAASRPNREAIDHDRRKLLTGAAMGLAAAGFASLVPVRPAQAATADEIRPFHINIPEADLSDLRRRLAATRWPEEETVADDSQGVPAGDAAGPRALLAVRLRLAQD
jgi:hypothetical protein